MSKSIVAQKKINTDCIAKYYLVEDISAEMNCILYGVEVEFFDADMQLKTRECVRKISQSKNFVMKLIEFLARKDVTPNSLIDIIDEAIDMLQV